MATNIVIEKVLDIHDATQNESQEISFRVVSGDESKLKYFWSDNILLSDYGYSDSTDLSRFWNFAKYYNSKSINYKARVSGNVIVKVVAYDESSDSWSNTLVYSCNILAIPQFTPECHSAVYQDGKYIHMFRGYICDNTTHDIDVYIGKVNEDGTVDYSESSDGCGYIGKNSETLSHDIIISNEDYNFYKLKFVDNTDYASEYCQDINFERTGFGYSVGRLNALGYTLWYSNTLYQSANVTDYFYTSAIGLTNVIKESIKIKDVFSTEKTSTVNFYVNDGNSTSSKSVQKTSVLNHIKDDFGSVLHVDDDYTPTWSTHILPVYDDTIESYQLIAPNKEGYTFVNWTDSNGNTYIANATITPQSDVTYTANFEAVVADNVFPNIKVISGGSQRQEEYECTLKVECLCDDTLEYYWSDNVTNYKHQYNQFDDTVRIPCFNDNASQYLSSNTIQYPCSTAGNIVVKCKAKNTVTGEWSNEAVMSFVVTPHPKVKVEYIGIVEHEGKQCHKFHADVSDITLPIVMYEYYNESGVLYNIFEDTDHYMPIDEVPSDFRVYIEDEIGGTYIEEKLPTDMDGTPFTYEHDCYYHPLETYVVTYKNGDVLVDTVNVTEGNQTPAHASVTKENTTNNNAGVFTYVVDGQSTTSNITSVTAYTFYRWANVGNTVTYEANQNFTPTSSITLYATYNEAVTVNQVKLAKPSKEGYEFVKWNASDGTSFGDVYFTPTNGATYTAEFSQIEVPTPPEDDEPEVPPVVVETPILEMESDESCHAAGDVFSITVNTNATTVTATTSNSTVAIIESVVGKTINVRCLKEGVTLINVTTASSDSLDGTISKSQSIVVCLNTWYKLSTKSPLNVNEDLRWEMKYMHWNFTTENFDCTKPTVHKIKATCEIEGNTEEKDVYLFNIPDGYGYFQGEWKDNDPYFICWKDNVFYHLSMPIGAVYGSSNANKAFVAKVNSSLYRGEITLNIKRENEL